ncbi:MAG: hypothetical protein AABP62_14615 [Planctomycetota bacterium]
MTSHLEVRERTAACDVSPGTRVECRSSKPFVRWQTALPGTRVFAAYQAGKLPLLGWHRPQSSLLMRHFSKPMGLDVGPVKPAPFTRHEINRSITNAHSDIR